MVNPFEEPLKVRSPACFPHPRAAAALLLLVMLAAGGCSDEEDGLTADSGRADGRWNVLLITLDTVRSDRLGCYGYAESTSPNLDSLAARGVLFRRAVAPAPITLPSHATILTGLDPHEHGVRNNSGFALDSSQKTLTEALSGKGYATGATLGAFPVEKRFGLAQGFGVYDDDFPIAQDIAALRQVQREASDVTKKALGWIDKNKGKPFFHWAHYFDPHFPYEPPAPYAKAFENPYDGEIAKMDAALGDLIKGLERMRLLDKTWILCVGDHGESLGEHGELTHTMLIYGATQYVPCLLVPPVAWKGLPSAKIRGRVVEEVVRLKDLAPTVIDILGLETSALAASGETLIPLIEGSWEGPGAAYMETLVPSLECGWSELRGVRTSRWCYIAAPEPELYDVVSDPGEVKNVYKENPEIVRRLSALCDSFVDRDVGLNTVAPDPEAVARLRNLGYTASPVRRRSSPGGKDPKKMMHLFFKINDARTAAGTSKPDEAIDLLESVLEEDPFNPLATRLMGDSLLVKGRSAAARDLFKNYLKEFPEDTEIINKLGQALIATKQLSEAREVLEKRVEEEPGNSEACDLFSKLLVQMGEMEGARAFLEKNLEQNPDSADPCARFAFFLILQGETTRGNELLDKALVMDSKHARANGLKGEMLFTMAGQEQKSGRQAEASKLLRESRSHFEVALSSDPLESVAALRVATFLFAEKKFDKAVQLCRNALVRRPDMVEAHVFLTKVLTMMKKYEEVICHYQAAISLGYENPGFLLNYGSVLYATGRDDKALKTWNRALSLDPTPETAEKLRLSIDRLKNKK